MAFLRFLCEVGEDYTIIVVSVDLIQFYISPVQSPKKSQYDRKECKHMSYIPYRKAVFVRISDEYAANCIVNSNCSLYIHFLSRIPGEKSWSNRKVIAKCLQLVI